jgi:Transmembrane secretion effector
VRAALSSRRLRRIVAAYTVNRLGTWFGFVALSVAVFDHTHSALAVAALLLAGQVLPAFLAPALIARVEASERAGTLAALYAVEALATVGLALLIVHFWLPAVLLLVAIDGSAALAANALLRAEAARAGRERVAEGAAGEGDQGQSAESERERAEQLHEGERQANAAINVAFSATFTLGPAIAGAIVAGAGAAAALWIDAASFAICGAMLVDLRPYVQETGTASVRARLNAAWRHIQAVPALRTILLIEAIALVFFEFAGPIEIAYAKATLHAGDRGYGLLLTVWGAGVVLGSIVFARSSGRGPGAMLAGGTLAIGLAYVGFAAAPSLGVACGAALVGGIGNGVQWASVVSAVQRLTPPRLQGRLMGALESISAISPALGLSAGGALAVALSPRGAFLIAGLGAAAGAAAFLRLAMRGLGHPDEPIPLGAVPLAHPASAPQDGPEPRTAPVPAHAERPQER